MPAPATFTLFPAGLAETGLSLKALCARAGVAPSRSLPTDAFFRLWTAAEAAADDRGAGLRFGAAGIARGYGVAALVALHAPDLRAAIGALARYKRLTCPELVELDVAGDEATVRYRWLQASGEVPRLLADTVLASLAALARHGTGGQVTPLRVELARRPADAALLRAHFGCPIRFGAAHDAMVFAADALDRPFVNADGGAFARLLPGLEGRLASADGATLLRGEVRVAIARRMSEGRAPAIGAVAAQMELSARTLQRRLGAAGTSFGDELAAVRRITATRLLAQTDLDPVAIALLLGFAEPNSFARAFRGWERTSPARWRQLQTSPARTAAS